jgi:hypothetical protein
MRPFVAVDFMRKARAGPPQAFLTDQALGNFACEISK